MKKIIPILLMAAPVAVAAQEMRTIKGKVISTSDKLGLPGASVYIDQQSVGTATGEAGVIANYTIGTTTNFDGEFSLKVPADLKQISASFIGFENAVITLTEKDYYIIKLDEQSLDLEEVVVTGYQNVERRKLTAAVSKVETKDILQASTSNIDQMLEGQLAGVQISPSSGGPGEAAKIRIRGTASLNGNQDPLWVLDGMPLEGTEIPDLDSEEIDVDRLTNTSIAGLNPNDIESITVLKDAAATAIYGARAANGVIVVTTKNGREGKININYSGNVSITTAPNMDRLNLLDSNQKVDLELGLAANPFISDYDSPYVGVSDWAKKGSVARILMANGEYDLFQTGGFDAISATSQQAINALRGINTDWSKQLYQTAVNHNHSLSISGGTKKADYYLSLGYYDEQGSTIGTSMDRLNLTLKTNYRLARNFKVGAAVYANQVNRDSYLTGTGSHTNPSKYSRTANPYTPIYNEDGSYHYDPEVVGTSDKYIDFNFLEERNGTSNTIKSQGLSAIFDAEWKIIPELTLTTQFGLQTSYDGTEQVALENTYVARKERERSVNYEGEYWLPEGGFIRNWNANSTQWNWKTMLQYNKMFADKHELDVMVGSELRRTYDNTIYTMGYGYDEKTLTTKPVIFPSESEYNTFKLYDKNVYENAYASFFGTASYTYDYRYTVFGSMRYDGSNLFGVDPKYRYLPLWSAGASWTVSEEDWMKNQSVISQLKIRGSYGLQGNIDKSTSPFIVGDYGNSSLLPGVNEPTIDVLNPPNDKLRWEKTSTWNVGADLGLFKNRIFIGFDAYSRYSSDLVGLRSIPLENGFSTLSVNWAELSNKGYEISLTTRNIQNKNFTWSTTFNLGQNTNKVEQMHIHDNQQTPSLEGHSVNSLFGFKTAGLDEYGIPMFELDGQAVTMKEFFQLEAADWGWGPIPEYTESKLSTEELRDRYSYIGTTDPKFSGGIINNFTYKGFSLNISATLNLGQWVKETPFYNNVSFDRGANTSDRIYDVWSETNTDGIYPAIFSPDSYGGARAQEYYYFSNTPSLLNDLDIWYKKINYLRINSIRFGYQLPQNWVDKMGIGSAKLTFEARNPFVFGTDYDGYFDPETYGNIYAQPIAKSYTFGVNVSF